VLCGGHTLLATEYTPCRGLVLRILQTFCGAGSGRDGSLAAEVLGGDIRLPPQREHADQHDHSNMIVLSRVLYDFDGDFDRMDVDRNAVVDDDDRNNGDVRRLLSVLRVSFKIVKEYY